MRLLILLVLLFLQTALLSISSDASDILPACSRSPWIKAYLEYMNLKSCEKITDDEIRQVRVPMAGEIARLREHKLIGEGTISIRKGDFDGFDTDGIDYVNLRRSGIESISEGVFKAFKTPFMLKLAGNKLTEIPTDFLGSNESVIDLDLSDNPIKVIREHAIHHLPLLHSIHLLNTDLESMEQNAIHSLPLVRWIDFTDSKLKRIDSHTMDKMPSLGWLCYDRNQIEKVDSGAFSNFSTLSWISLRKNKIHTIKEGAFRRLPSLIWVDLAYNDLESIPKGIFYNTPAIVTLYLGMNRIRTIDKHAFKDLPSLEFVCLSKQKSSQEYPIHIDKAAFRLQRRGLILRLSNPRIVDRSTGLRLMWMQTSGKLVLHWNEDPAS